jgi:hypothetical protein
MYTYIRVTLRHKIQAHAASGRLDLTRFYCELLVLYSPHRQMRGHIVPGMVVFGKTHRFRRTIYGMITIACLLPFRY